MSKTHILSEKNRSSQMKKIIHLIVPVLLLVSTVGFGQALNPKQKKQILKELISLVEKNYVLQDSVQEIKNHLEKAQNSEAFNKEYSASQFGAYLTTMLRSITRDAHFAVLHDPGMYQMVLAMQQGPASGVAQNAALGGRNLNDSRKNFFFTKLEILGGNVGYLKIEQIPPLESARATVDASMAFLKHTHALVIDLRSNPGGVGGFIPYLMSYFLPGNRQLLYTREFLAMDSTSYLYTHEDLGGDRYLDKPVYILINRFTGSAATNMAYTMKSFDAALLVGENTGLGYRGAHSATVLPLQENLVGIVPVGRVVNAKTKTNWRENGVDPDIACPPEDALGIAHQTALQYLISQNSNPEIKNELNAALESLQNNQSAKSEENVSEDLSEYAGQYGETTISWENGKLFTKRPTVPVKLEIRRKEGEMFKIILPPNARGNVPDLQFNRKDGQIISLTTIRDGNEERTEKKE